MGVESRCIVRKLVDDAWPCVAYKAEIKLTEVEPSPAVIVVTGDLLPNADIAWDWRGVAHRRRNAEIAVIVALAKLVTLGKEQCCSTAPESGHP